MILTFYGGGFATVPAYLKDLFGTYQVGAIHGRLLTAWSLAGILGPLIINYIADTQKDAGETGPALYETSFFVMIGLLAVGFVANELIRPVHEMHHEAEGGDAEADEGGEEEKKPTRSAGTAPLRVLVSWACVVLPFAYGVFELALKVFKLFE